MSQQALAVPIVGTGLCAGGGESTLKRPLQFTLPDRPFLMMGDPVTRGAQRRRDLFTRHLASKFVAMLGGGSVAACGGDVEPFVRFHQVDLAASARAQEDRPLEGAVRQLG
jgi:hypothetical protein